MEKKTRVNASLSQDVHHKLEMLSQSCGMTKTSMAAHLIERLLNDIQGVELIQKELSSQANSQLHVTATKVNERVMFRYTHFLTK